jgi:uncharacterized protein (TIGR02001 family)
MAQQKAAEPAYTFEGNFTVTSDYIFRGFTQSNSTAAIQGGFDLNHSSGFYVGTWASSVAYDSTLGGSLETNLYGGYTFSVGEVGIDVGLLRYYYPKQENSTKWDTTEAYVGLSYGPIGFKVSRAMTSYFGGTGDKGTMYYALSGSYPISENISVNGYYGYESLKGGDNYQDYKIGLSTEIGGYTLAGDYVDASSGLGRNDGKFVVSVSKSF